jgi:phospholipid-translocating ATPase
MKFVGELTCDPPNESLEYWNGNLSSSLLKNTLNCDISTTILRGCSLKNTEYCYGLVIYVGNDTKIMRNAKSSIRKVSNLMKLMNIMLYTVFAF